MHCFGAAFLACRVQIAGTVTPIIVGYLLLCFSKRLLYVSKRSSDLGVQVPKGTSKGHGTEFGMHLGLVETGYEDRKVKVKTKESNPAKQVQLETGFDAQLPVCTASKPFHMYTQFHLLHWQQRDRFDRV